MQCPSCQRTWPDEFKVCPVCVVSLSAEMGEGASGAIAQAGGVAAGAGGVAVGGDVHGNVYVGPLPKDQTQALRIYRRVLVQTSGRLPLRGVDVGASDPASGQQCLDLAQVYVNLDTKTQVPLTESEKKRRSERVLPEERETRPLGALEASIQNRRLVLLGDPGSGKSTFVYHLALCLALHNLEPQAGWLDRLPGWPEGEGDALPIVVILRDFARWLSEVAQAEPRHLWDFIVSRLEAQNLAFAADPLCQAVEAGQAVVLLDGLDEIPTQARRTTVRDAVMAFAGRYPRIRLAVTCRTLSYQDPTWQLADIPAFELAPFDEEKIDHFIGAWYEELARLGVVKAEEATRLAGRLQKAVRRPDLWRMAPNPLLLTVMALVHTHKGRLPDARALLYEDTVDILLWRWEQIKSGGDEAAPRLSRLPLDTDDAAVRFYHQLLQEYFAARELGQWVATGETLTGYWPEGCWWGPSGWEETFILLAGMLSDASALLVKLAAVNPVVAARCLLEGDAQANANARLNVVQSLTTNIASEALPPVGRVQAGDALARLGDPRFRADVWYLPDEPLLGFVEIPAGAFLMGSDNERDPGAYGDELPQHKVELPTYYSARYPVTVAQFRTFVRESRYEAQEPWERYSSLDNHPVVAVTWYDALAYCRWLTDELQTWEGTPEPLVRLLREEGWQVRLPSEAEWEKTARGTDGRIFPWGDKPDPNRANYDDTGIGTTSAVGCFLGGTSPYGVHDLSGNVWEWCHSLYEDYVYDPADGRENPEAGGIRVLRGGAFFKYEWIVRCAYRGRFNPSYRLDGIGFRVVLAPGF